MADPITILIVDDHEVVRKGVRGYLDSLPEFEVVGEAYSGEEAIDLVKLYIPDVVLMDLILPGSHLMLLEDRGRQHRHRTYQE